MGTDGIPIDKLVVQPDPNLEAVAAEYTTLLRASVSAASDTGLGELHELCVVTDKMVTLIVGITAEYFLFAAFAPGAVTGRARFVLRMAGMALEKEFL
jgi:predicted regulator of Ras-like GTPase activity (Roadblock/LC7/MglB family)